jgi:hypothetical protein
MQQLSGLRHASVSVVDDDAYPEPGQASVLLRFGDGTRFKAAYWRVVANGRARLSSFDHEQKYGLPAPIDAKNGLREILRGRTCVEARLDGRTGDLSFGFDGDVSLQVFNFTGYEIWEIRFPDGTEELSNYVLAR